MSKYTDDALKLLVAFVRNFTIFMLRIASDLYSLSCVEKEKES